MVSTLVRALAMYLVSLSTQEYKWVPANCQGNLTECWGGGGGSSNTPILTLYSLAVMSHLAQNT